MPRRSRIDVTTLRLGHDCPLCGVYVEPKDIMRLDSYGNMRCPHCKRDYDHPPPPAR